MSVALLLAGWVANKLRPYFGLKADTVSRWLLIAGGLVAVGLLILALGFGIKSCYVSKRIVENRAEIQEAQTAAIKAIEDAHRIESDIAATREEKRVAKEKAEEAQKELEKVIESDSSAEPSDFDIVRQRFCQLYPKDRKCLK